MTSIMICRAMSAHPQRLIAAFAIISRLVPWILLHVLRCIPAFDPSAQYLSRLPGSATIRWDAIHFAAIAKDGFQFEQQIAFQPGWPLLLRRLSSALAGLGLEYPREAAITRVGEAVACASYVGAAVMLYRLTALLYDPTFALMASVLYLLPPAPAVMSSPMTEPIFALLTFTGFYFGVKRQFLISSLFLAGATSVRATGVLAVGPVAWMILFGDQPLSSTLLKPGLLLHRAALCTLPTAIITSPFLASQTYFYFALCQGNAPESWCGKLLPMAYSHVQEKYWNVGLLNYWTPAQIPNLLLALPVLVISFGGAYRYFANLLQNTQPELRPSQTNKSVSSPRSNPDSNSISAVAATRTYRLLPFYIHSTALTFLLAFSAHTQIALRVCVTDPVIWWSLIGMAFRWGDAGALIRQGKLVEKERRPGSMTPIGKAWIWWVVVYGAISIVLWAGHYPPA